MNKLEELNLNENQITKINGLKGLVNVKSLHISHNGI
jgi:Leucine-rich repeat (LRR) protein